MVYEPKETFENDSRIIGYCIAKNYYDWYDSHHQPCRFLCAVAGVAVNGLLLKIGLKAHLQH